jgi:hypothetical protein
MPSLQIQFNRADIEGFSAVIEATVFEDSDLGRLVEPYPLLGETIKNILGHAFFPDASESSLSGEVFVDRLCEAVWEIKCRWRYDNVSRKQLQFKRKLRKADLHMFYMACEYAVLHELLHVLQDESLIKEVQVHSAATVLLRANHS